MAAKAKILIVDDEEDFRNSVRTLLESHDYEVIEAISGKDGLQKVVEHEPDLILLDIMMETFEEGYGISQAIKFQEPYKKYRNIPIIMVSSIQESPDERFSLAPSELEMIRPKYYITKPIDIPSFLALIQKVLKKRI